ncbi:MAG: sporulation protein YqfD [Eubacteriales bacterium]|nr:sporulation protein YqfD [Eubacteriales bacterium]MDD4629904.1 sporulation protein YqfD [Eubacteriales bacterium]
MKNRGSFFEHSIKIRVEGFELRKLLTECVQRGITVKDVRTISDIEVVLILMKWDYEKFLSLAKNRYKITVLNEYGYKPTIRKAFHKKSTILGLIIFAIIMFYQSSFVSEIQVSGYLSYSETEIRDSLREAGLFEGCSKDIDLKNVKLHIYQELDNIAWMGVRYIGNLAEVTIVEGTITPKPVDKSKPCNIVAKKEGYVEKTIAREGKIAAEPGTYVKPGDILVSGIVPVTSTAYGTPAVGLTERYVHASGEVYAKIPYRLQCYQEKYDYIKKETGPYILGIRFEFGDLKINTAKHLYNYDNSIYTEKEILKIVRPIPITIGFVKISEVEVSRIERSQTELKKEANTLTRSVISEKVPENTQILNKSLKFVSGENIIEVVIIFETLEEIGVKKEIIIGNTTD